MNEKTEKTLRLNPFMRCVCGKLHVRIFVSRMSKCTCDRELWGAAWTN